MMFDMIIVYCNKYIVVLILPLNLILKHILKYVFSIVTSLLMMIMFTSTNYKQGVLKNLPLHVKRKVQPVRHMIKDQ
jgi:hypothetical protein